MLSASEQQRYNSIEHYQAAIGYFTRIATEWKQETFADPSISDLERSLRLEIANQKLKDVIARIHAHLESLKSSPSLGPLAMVSRFFCGPSNDDF